MKKILKSEQGITLVALVVTIVVLIILAGITLSLVVGQNGIVNKTKEARDKTQTDQLNTELAMNTLYNDMTKAISGTGGATTSPYLPSADYSYDTSTSLSTGLVMKDTSGNEWVWIEVPKTATVYPTAGTSITTFSDTDYTNIETDLHTYTSTYRNGTSYTDTYYSDAQTGLTSAEYTTLKKAMLKSVYQNGGFWIGRYEAGIANNRTSHTTVDTTTKPLIKANQYPYTYVTCSEAETLAKTVATSSGKNSSLLFGVQWDLVLKYLETKGATQAELKTDSTSWGNYHNNTYNIIEALAKYSTDNGSSWTATPYNKTVSGGVTLLTTGALNKFSKMNIYDIAGNVWEWTMEYTSNSSSPCTMRGGNCNNLGQEYPVSYRTNDSTTDSYYTMGFRVAIY